MIASCKSFQKGALHSKNWSKCSLWQAMEVGFIWGPGTSLEWDHLRLRWPTCFSWCKIPEVLVSLVSWGQARCLPLAVQFYSCFRRLAHPLCVVVAVQAGLSFVLMTDKSMRCFPQCFSYLKFSVRGSCFPPGSELWSMWGRWTEEEKLTLVCTEWLDANLFAFGLPAEIAVCR